MEMAAPAAPLASAPSGGAAPPFRGPGHSKPRDQTSRQRGALRKQTWKLNEIDAV